MRSWRFQAPDKRAGPILVRQSQTDSPMPTMLAELQQLLDGTRPPPPIATLIGFSLTAISPGEVVVEFTAGRQHANPMGTLHGGILCDIADAAMGMAYARTLAEGETFTTLELKINYLRPVWTGQLRAVGRIVKRGNTVGLVECDITDEQQRLVARASSTCMTLRGEEARGR
ncbi:MAG: PaaI family thioesterase [Gemmatimonadaceae bacterium]